MPSWLERMWDLYNSAPTPPRERDEGGDNAPPEQESPGEDFDANAWLNVAQRRHDAWDEAREQQQLLNTPLAQLMPQDLGAWAQAYLRSKAHEWTPEQATGFGYGFQRAEQEDNLSKWLEPIKRHYAAEQATKPGTPTGEMTQPNEYGLTFPVTTPKPEEGIVNKWLGNFLPTPEEEELARRLPYGGIGSIPYAARAAGNLLAPIGAAHEAARENVPGVGGFEDYILPGLWSLALGGGFDQQKRIYDPAFHSLSDEDQQTILSAQQRGEYAPPMAWGEQARLNAAMGRLDDKMQELRALDTRSVEERVRDAHEAYAKEIPLPAQAALGFIDPVYLALGLAGRGLFTSAEELAARAGANATLAERLKRVLPGITKPRRAPGTGAPGALEEAADIEGAQAAKELPKASELEEGILANSKPIPELGPQLTQFRHNAQGAIRKLMELKSGDAIAALHHHQVGDFDLIWGAPPHEKNPGYGLAKIAVKHPEVLDDLQGIISSLSVKSRSPSQIVLASDTHRAVVSLDWYRRAKRWLLTAYELNK